MEQTCSNSNATDAINATRLAHHIETEPYLCFEKSLPASSGLAGAPPSWILEEVRLNFLSSNGTNGTVDMSKLPDGQYALMTQYNDNILGSSITAEVPVFVDNTNAPNLGLGLTTPDAPQVAGTNPMGTQYCDAVGVANEKRANGKRFINCIPAIDFSNFDTGNGKRDTYAIIFKKLFGINDHTPVATEDQDMPIVVSGPIGRNFVFTGNSLQLDAVNAKIATKAAATTPNGSSRFPIPTTDSVATNSSVLTQSILNDDNMKSVCTGQHGTYYGNSVCMQTLEGGYKRFKFDITTDASNIRVSWSLTCNSGFAANGEACVKVNVSVPSYGEQSTSSGGGDAPSVQGQGYSFP